MLSPHHLPGVADSHQGNSNKTNWLVTAEGGVAYRLTQRSQRALRLLCVTTHDRRRACAPSLDAPLGSGASEVPSLHGR